MTFDRKSIWIAVSLCATLILAVANWSAMANPEWPSGWYDLTPHDFPSGKPSYGWMPEALFVDLPPLDLTSLNGKVKLISSAKPTWEKCPVGYVIDLETLPIPKDKVPEKYKKERKLFDSPAGPVTKPPLDEAVYEIHFEFHLNDADGFEIATIESPKHILESGDKARFQSQTEPALTIGQANRVESVTVEMTVDKCVSAED